MLAVDGVTIMSSGLPSAGSAGPSLALRCGAIAWVRCLGAAMGIAAAVVLVPAVLAANKVTVTFDGEIARECTITSLGGQGSSADWPLVVGDITKAGAKEFGFTLNCNAPFSYRLEAQYGALTHRSVSAAAGGFVASVPYEVGVYIPTDGGAINDTCSGDSIRAGAVRCAFTHSGNAIALAGAGHLRVAWTPGGVPMAGEYSDRLTITVGVRE